MNSARCLVCSEPLQSGRYHSKCAKALFGVVTPPNLSFSQKDVEGWGRKLVQSRLAVAGVQQKISLGLKKSEDAEHRITVLGVLGGTHILKPPAPAYPEMPELEHLTMRLAQKAGIVTASCGLIPMVDGSLAYIVRRFDRFGKNGKLAVEDLCQLSELATQDKYKSSCEKAGKIIRRFSHNPGADALRFFELVLASFLLGNSDMHLKNYSLWESKTGIVGLSPAYDLLATQLLLNDAEESALTINGKKSKLRLDNFLALGRVLLIPEKALQTAIERQVAMRETWLPVFIKLIPPISRM